MTLNNRITLVCFGKMPATPLVAFRIIFGLLMLFGTLRFICYGWVYDLYILPEFHFTYFGFDWIRPLPGNWMCLPFALMAVASAGIILGYRFRVSAITFFLCFTYIELLDKTNYLNHYYLVSLLAFLLCWLPAHVQCSFDAKRDPSLYREYVPRWTILLLQLQIGVVYFFAGIAKLNPDWLLEAQPLRTWLQAFRDLPVVGNWFAASWLAYLFSWFGCLYDLTIPFFLSFRKTRSIAYCAVVLFHIVTWLLFPIGLFPWVMICTTSIFFPADFHEKWIGFIRRKMHRQMPASMYPLRSSFRKRVTVFFLSFYLTIQLVVPLRYLFYPGNLYWHEEGFRFSWRVMLMHKEGYAVFYVSDRQTGRSIEIDNSSYLTPTQIDQMATQPDMILQFAHYLGDRFHDTTLHFGNRTIHLKDPAVGAEVFACLNGRPHAQMVNRSKDLMKYHNSLKHKDWLMDFPQK